MEKSDIHIRQMVPDDVHGGLLETLDALLPTSTMDRQRARRICEKLCTDPDHVVAVAVANGRVLGTASILFERKIIHDGGLAGHIEDVAVLEESQGTRIGTNLVKYLLEVAQKRGCYRTTLDCKEHLVGFYSRLGLKPSGVSMRIYHK